MKTSSPTWPALAAIAIASTAALPSHATTLRSVGNNRFVSAAAAGTGILTATAQVASSWEDFDVISNANGTVSLRSRISGNFVSADMGLAAPNTSDLVANRPTASQWEQFRLVPQPDGNVALLASANNLYVSADQNLGGTLVASRISVQAWEEFVLSDGASPPPSATPDFGSAVHVFNPS